MPGVGHRLFDQCVAARDSVVDRHATKPINCRGAGLGTDFADQAAHQTGVQHFEWDVLGFRGKRIVPNGGDLVLHGLSFR